MNPIPDIKRVMIRALARTEGIPMPDSGLESAASDAVVPRPLLSDIHQAKRELESGGLIHAERDELIGVTWTLTPKGEHKAGQLG